VVSSLAYLNLLRIKGAYGSMDEKG
jgi:hypothetical protein